MAAIQAQRRNRILRPSTRRRSPLSDTTITASMTRLPLEMMESPKKLTDLPPELLEEIFHYLDSIDDVHSLGRTHNRIHHVIKRQTVYTELMRSIVARSPTHRYDIQLCKTLELHGQVTRHFQNGGTLFPVTPTHNNLGYNEWETALANTTTLDTCPFGPCSMCIPDSTVHEILARYQGVRMLEDMWLERELEEQDFLAADATSDEKDLNHRYSCLLSRAQDFEQGDLDARSSKNPATKAYTSLNPDQRGRFYSAVTFVWILNELRWVLTNFVNTPRSYWHLQLMDQCRGDLAALELNPVLDQLDQYSVFMFMYHHLLPLHSPVLQDQDSSKLPFTFEAGGQVTPAKPLRFLPLFLAAGQTYFQPPDLIELAVRHRVSRKTPYPRMSLPVTTEQWIRPSSASTFPSGMDVDDPRYSSVITRHVNAHIGVINRSSFAQSRAGFNLLSRRPLPMSFIVSDYARTYFVESASIALAKGESCEEGEGPNQCIFTSGMWQKRGMWSVWWWANSEDKTRAIIARWRKSKSL